MDYTRRSRRLGCLRSIANYSWTTTTVTPGAPFIIALIKGDNGYDWFRRPVFATWLEKLQAVVAGNRGLVKVGAEGKISAEISGGKGAVFVDDEL